MRKYHGIPELLEAYMEENAADERWITAHELRNRFGLTRYPEQYGIGIPAEVEAWAV